MIEPPFLACVAAAPADRRAGRLQFVDVLVAACALGARAQLASWREGFPSRNALGWACRDRVSTAKEP